MNNKKFSPLIKAKETVVEYSVLTAFTIIGLLLLIFWQAVPSSFWSWVSTLVPTSVLWALIGILVILLILQSVYTIQLYTKTKSKLIHFSGVLWDRDHNLFCPKDEAPLFQSGRNGNVTGQGVEVFQCSKCDKEFVFRNGDGVQIRFNQAQQNFIEKMQVLPGKNFQKIKPPTIEDYFDEISVEILKKFGLTAVRHISVDQLTPTMIHQPGVISHHLDILLHKNFIKQTNYSSTPNNNPCYELTEVGRAYLVKNDFI